MKKDQRIENALHASSLKPLSDEQISDAKNRVWAAIQHEKDNKAAISFWSFSFNRQLVSVLATYSLIIAILIGSTFALLPAPQQTQTLAIIKKTLRVDAPQDQPSDSSNNNVATDKPTTPPVTDTKKDETPTKSTYTNTELAFSVELPGKFEKKPSDISKPGFEQKDQLDVTSSNKSKTTFAVYIADNDKNQNITDWVKTHNVRGEQSTVSFGSFSGVIVKNKPVARGLLSSFVAHAAIPATEDFYTVKNGDILLLSAQSEATLTPPNYNDAFKTYKRSPMKVARSKFAYTEYDGKIYILGGSTNQLTPKDNTSHVDSITRYDPLLDTWTDLATLPNPILFGDNTTRFLAPLEQAVALKGKIYYLPEYFSQAEDGKTNISVFDIATATWERKTLINPDMVKNHLQNSPNGINSPSVNTIGDDIYFIGGRYFTGETISSGYGVKDQIVASNEVFIYTPATDTWRKGPNLVVGRNKPTVTMHNNRLYTTYGNFGDMTSLEYNYDHYGLTPTVEYLDFAQNKWIQTKDFVDLNFINPPSLVDVSGALYLLGRYTGIDKDPNDNWADIIVQAYSYDEATTEWKYLTKQFDITNLTGVIGMGNSAYLIGGARDSTYITEFVPKPK